MKIIKAMIGYGAIVALALAPTAVLADSPDYTYIEGGYINADFDGGGDADGFGISGSAEVGENIFMFAGYSSIGDAGVDLNSFDVGIGYKSAISDTTDVNVSIAYVSAEIDFGFFGSNREDGYALDVSLRSMVSNEFELNGGITYVDLGGGADDTAFNVGGVYSFNDSFAVTGGISFSNDVTTFGIGGRFYVE